MFLPNLTMAVHLSVRPSPSPSWYLRIQDPVCALVLDIPGAPRSPSSSDNREWPGLGSAFQLCHLKPVIVSQELLLKSFGILEGKSCEVQTVGWGCWGSECPVSALCQESHSQYLSPLGNSQYSRISLQHSCFQACQCVRVKSRHGFSSRGTRRKGQGQTGTHWKLLMRSWATLGVWPRKLAGQEALSLKTYLDRYSPFPFFFMFFFFFFWPLLQIIFLNRPSPAPLGWVCLGQMHVH